MIVCEVTGSSPAVGESYSTTCGRLTSARAMETRRRMPPESSDGNLSIVSSISTNRSDSRTRGSISSSSTCSSRKAIGDVVGDAQGIEQRALLKHKSDLAAESRAIPFPTCCPDRAPACAPFPSPGWSSPAASFSASVFPDPLSPIRTLVSLGSHRKRQTVQDIAFVEADAYIFKGDNRFAGRVRAHCGMMRAPGTTRAGRAHSLEAIIDANSPSAATDCIDCSAKLENMAGKKQHEFGEEEIGDQDEYRGHHHGLSGGAADALRSAAHVQPLIAAHRRRE